MDWWLPTSSRFRMRLGCEYSRRQMCLLWEGVVAKVSHCLSILLLFAACVNSRVPWRFSEVNVWKSLSKASLLLAPRRRNTVVLKSGDRSWGQDFPREIRNQQSVISCCFTSSLTYSNNVSSRASQTDLFLRWTAEVANPPPQRCPSARAL